MKMRYFINDKGQYLMYDENYNRLGSGYHYKLSQVRRSAKLQGFDGIQKVDYAFVEKAFNLVANKGI